MIDFKKGSRICKDRKTEFCVELREKSQLGTSEISKFFNLTPFQESKEVFGCFKFQNIAFFYEFKKAESAFRLKSGIP